MQAQVFVGGYDIASVSSGVTFVQGLYDPSTGVTLKAFAEKAYRHENNFLGHHTGVMQMIADTKAVNDHIGDALELCIIEDYIMTAHTVVSYSTGDVMGMLASRLYEARFPILYNHPVKMRSFVARGKRFPGGTAGKRLIMRTAEEEFGYRSKQRLVKQRTDCSDAFWHAVMGVNLLFWMQGVPIDELLPDPKRAALYVNKKAAGITQVLGKNLYVPLNCPSKILRRT